MKGIILVMVGVKGIVMAGVLHLASISFLESIIVAAVSATLTGAFAVFAVWVAWDLQQKANRIAKQEEIERRKNGG